MYIDKDPPKKMFFQSLSILVVSLLKLVTNYNDVVQIIVSPAIHKYLFYDAEIS